MLKLDYFLEHDSSWTFRYTPKLINLKTQTLIRGLHIEDFNQIIKI